MKRIIMILALTLAALSFSSIQAEEHVVLLDHVVGELPNNRLTPDTDIEFHLRIRSNGAPTCIISPSMGFVISSYDGAEWDTTTATLADVVVDTILLDPLYIDTIDFSNWFDFWFLEGMGLTGSGADSIGFAGGSYGDMPAVFDGLDSVVMWLTIHPTLASDEKHICLDIAPSMSGFEWEWSAIGITPEIDCHFDAVEPTWEGPYCWEVWVEKDEPPEFDNPTESITGSHCEQFIADFDAYDPDPAMGPGPNTVSYSLGSGSVGTIHPTTGVWTWTPSGISDVGVVYDVWIVVTEGDGPIDSVLMTAEATNLAPVFTAGCGLTYEADVDDESEIVFMASDNCPGDPIEYSVISNGYAAGAYSFTGNVLSYTPVTGDLGLRTWLIGVTDGADTGTCTISMNVTVDEPPEIGGSLALVGSHCGLSQTYSGTDPDGSDAVTFSLVSGVGSITSVGMYTFSGTIADVGVPLSATIRASEADGEYTDAVIDITATNEAPAFTGGCDVTYEVNIDDEYQIPFTASDICPGDPKNFFLADYAGAVGSHSLSGAGVLTYTPNVADAGVRVWTIGVTDDLDTSLCTFSFDVTPDDPPLITGDPALSGSHCVTISRTFTGTDPDGSDPVTFTLQSGVGSITENGVYTYDGSMGDVGTLLAATIRGQESDGEYTDVVLSITVTNAPPVFSSGCGLTWEVNIDDEYEIPFAAYDICAGDPMTFIVVDNDGAMGAFSFTGSVLSYTPDAIDLGVRTWTIAVTDDQDTSQCTIVFDVTPDDPPQIAGNATLAGSHCETITETYIGSDTDGDDAVEFTLLSGVGSISPDGEYVYTPHFADVGTTHSVFIRATEADGEYTDWELAIIATNEAPVFTAGCDWDSLARTDRVTEVLFEATDVCPGDPMTFFVKDDAGTHGFYSFVGNKLSYFAVEEDEGDQWWFIGVTDGVDTSLCMIRFQVFVGCCGLYNNGYTGNTNYSIDGKITIADIARLIDRVYISLEPLTCPENGNANGDPLNMINLSDIARLIDHVYISLLPTATCP